MMARKLCWLLAQISLAVLWAAFGDGAALALAAALFLIPLVSIPLNLYLRKKISLKLTAPANLRKGGVGTVKLVGKTPGLLPGAIVCTLRMENLLNGTVCRERLRLNGDSMAVAVTSDFCGRLRVTVERAKRYDCFGLMGLGLSCGEKCHITIQPDGFEARITLAQELGGPAESEQYSQHRPGSDLTETFQLREYVPGDSPRQIHWKLSSKLDRLMVREPGLPIVQDVLLFWERTAQEETLHTLDAQAETIVSIGRAMLEQDIRFRLGWNDAKENRCILHEIRELDDLIAVMPRLLSASGGGYQCHAGAALLMQTHPDALCSHMVYIAGTPAPEVLDWQSFGRLTVLTPDEHDYPAQLAALVL